MNRPRQRTRAPRFSTLTTIGTGGEVCDYVEVSPSVRGIAEVVRSARGAVAIIGAGSNLIGSDQGFPGTVVRLRATEPVRNPDGSVTIGAGASLDVLVEWALSERLTGLERLAGIPGTVGGAIVQNAGAYDVSFGGLVRSVDCLDSRSLEPKTFLNDECNFRYRYSVFQSQPHLIVVSATLELTQADLVSTAGIRELQELRDIPAAVFTQKLRHVREVKDHLLVPGRRTFGSFFRNFDQDLPSDHLTEVRETFQLRRAELSTGGTSVTQNMTLCRAGSAHLLAGSLIATSFDSRPDEFLPGAQHGRLTLGRGGPNTILNTGDATTEEILNLARRMRDRVFRVYNVKLSPEVVMLNCEL